MYTMPEPVYRTRDRTGRTSFEFTSRLERSGFIDGAAEILGGDLSPCQRVSWWRRPVKARCNCECNAFKMFDARYLGVTKGETSAAA
jgi:hypothetical protein